MRIRPAVLTALLLVPHGVAAQDVAAKPSLPVLSADATIGYSLNPDRVGEIYYKSTGSIATQLLLAIRLGSRGAVRPVLVLDYSGMPNLSGDDAVCLQAPNGTCREDFPSYYGFGAGLGFRAALAPDIVIGSIIGAARHRDHFTTEPGRRTSFFFDAEGAFRFSQHLGMVLRIRHVELPKAAGARVWFRPLLLGLRIQYGTL